MHSHRSVLMVFLDGVGIGTNDEKINPFVTAKMEFFRSLLGGNIPVKRKSRFTGSSYSLIPVHATLGVPGLPQSGTGQTALLTGMNAAKAIGKHFGPYPYSTLRPVLAEQSIFRSLAAGNLRGYYVNAFPHQYFDYMARQKSRMSSLAYSYVTSGGTLNDHERLRQGFALSADLTNERWPSLGYPDIPRITEEEAGRRLVEIAREYHFILYEYYFTDNAGHSCSMSQAHTVLEQIDRFLSGIFDAMHDESMLLIVTSDHGNIEDLSTKSHTRNPVPLLAAGKGHAHFAESVKSLVHIKPAIMEYYR